MTYPIPFRHLHTATGNHVSKTVTSGNTTENNQYVWDVNGGLPQVLIETDGQSTALSLYGLQRISTTDPLEQIYYHYDGLGSVRGLSDDSGTTVTTYSYDAFGEPGVTTGQVDNEFLFTGEQMDAETGLIYLRTRYYDPEIGRFISRDPFTGVDTIPQSLNRYVYVHNNPVRFTDPSGKHPVLAAAAIGAIVNEGWYVAMETDVGFGDQPFSWVTAGGRAAGGAAGGVAAVAAVRTGNPYVIGAATGEASYLVDRGTQLGLSSLGVPGTREDFTLEGAVLAGGGGAVMGKISYTAIPYSPTNTAPEMYARSVISRAGMSGIISGINYLPTAINSCQGPPIRLSKSSLALPGMGKE